MKPLMLMVVLGCAFKLLLMGHPLLAMLLAAGVIYRCRAGATRQTQEDGR